MSRRKGRRQGSTEGEEKGKRGREGGGEGKGGRREEGERLARGGEEPITASSHARHIPSPQDFDQGEREEIFPSDYKNLNLPKKRRFS